MIKFVFDNSKSTVCLCYLYTFAVRATGLFQAVCSNILWKLDLLKLQTPVFTGYSLTQLFWVTSIAVQDLKNKPSTESHQVTWYKVTTLVLNSWRFRISWAFWTGVDAHLWVWRVTAIRIHVKVIRNSDCWACTCCRGTRSLSAADSADPVTTLISSTCDSFTTCAKEKASQSSQKF